MQTSPVHNIYDINLNEQIVWPEVKTKDLFFETAKEPVFFDKTQKTGWEFIYREVESNGIKRKKAISLMSHRYGLIPNEEIHNEIMNYPEFNFKLDLNRSTNKSDRFFQMVYDIEGMDLNGGDKMSPKLVVKSSYDGTKPLTALFGFFRMICANLIVIPVSRETVFAFSAKHYKNFAFKDKIRNFIQATVNEKVFEDSKAKIMMTQQSNIVDIDYSFFAKLPNKELVLYIGMIQRYAKDVKVRIIDNEERLIYNIMSDESIKSMVERIVKGNNRNEDFVKNGTFDSWLDQVDLLKYPEEVLNQWQMYNMLIKVSHTYVNKERRLEKASFIAKHFLNQPALNP